MPEESFEQQLTEPALIFGAIMRINGLSSTIFSDASLSWSANARNYVEAVNNLSALCSRHMDKDFYKALGKLAAFYQKKLVEFNQKNPTRGGDTDAGRQLEMKLTLNYTHGKFALIMRQLDEKGILDEVKVHSTDEGKDLEEAFGSTP